MAIKPTTIVEWATANPQDPTSLQDAIIEPTAGKKASGFLRLEKPSRQDFNWVLNLIGLWIDYFEQTTDDNLANIATNTGDISTNAGNIVAATAAAGAAQDDIDDHIADTAGAHNDTAIANTSSVAGANVQLALNALLAAIKTPLREDKAPGSINFPSTIAVNSSGESDTFTFTGAAVSDSVLVQLLNRNSLGVNDNAKWCVFDGIITAPNTMKILVGNPNGVSTVPPADLEDANFRITVFPA